MIISPNYHFEISLNWISESRINSQYTSGKVEMYVFS